MIDWRTMAARLWFQVGKPAGHLLFPRICLSCKQADGAGDGLLCRPCRGRMGRLRRGRHCGRCGQSVGPHALSSPCAQCPTRWPLAGVLRVGQYGEPLNGVITAFKYGGRPELADTLGDWMIRRTGWTPIDAVVPVPLHPARRRSRGYNQSELLAAVVAGRLHRPLRHDLARIRNTAAQAGGSAAERRRNLEGAFALRKGAQPTGRRYLLVDDVMTTGATACEAARTLKRGGAASVTLLVLAVADPPTSAPTEDPPPA